MSNYIPVIGLEIHVELKTESKMFCQCSADYFGKKPNTNTCPVCLGMPGALPVPNRKAVEWTIKIAQALGCSINAISKFDRKHYFYPDLPKGYQISQYDEPIGIKGSIEVLRPDGTKKSVEITRVHLEEDTGKLTHSDEGTLVDFNRSSVPLVEIVTEPVFDTPEDVKLFLTELHTIIRFLEVSDADMEKGSMRMEPNISLRKKGEKGLPKYKVEVKNINSFNFAKKAVEYELRRQKEILEQGKTPEQETRGYNDSKGITFSQRSKENAQDYRYFPEPDIPPMRFDKKLLSEIQATIHELPSSAMKRFIKSYNVKPADAFILTRNKTSSKYFDSIAILTLSNKSGKNESPQNLPSQIASMIVNNRISVNDSVEASLEKVIKLLKPKETDLTLLSKTVDSILNTNSNVVSDYKSGKTNAVMFLIGKVMKEMKGNVDPETAKKMIIDHIEKL